MKILQIVHGFPPESIAGTESYCEALSRCLLERGHECVVLAGSGRGAQEPTLAIVDQDGLLVARYMRVEEQPYHWTDEFDPDAERLTRGLLALIKPDVVHLHHWLRLTNNLAGICTDLGIPKVVTLHDVWTTCPRIHRIRWDGGFCNDSPQTAPCLTCAERSAWQSDQEIARALALRREMMETELALADAITVPSEAHRALLVTLLGLPQERLIALSHGRLSPVMVKEGSGGRSAFPQRLLQIGHWGYLVYEKGAHVILEAVHKLRDPSAVQVHLIGPTVGQEYEQRLRELARNISVQFHGAYRPADLQAFDLDLAVFASITSESYSFALDEALGLGLPVLVADRGALPERIGGAGLTFRAGDADDLARRLQEILDVPEMLDKMRRGIRPNTLCSMEAHVAMLEKMYEDTTHTNKSNRGSATPYLKLIAHARQQVREREAALEARLAQAEQREAERAHLQTEFASLSQSCQATEARNAELAARLAAAEDRLAAQEATAATLAQEREAEARARLLAQQRAEELDSQLRSIEEARRAQIQELERAIDALVAERDDLMHRLTELERAPAARLQALLAKLNRGKKAE